jgi:hypothetical protein
MDILRALLPRLTGRQFAFITIPLILLGGATASAVAVLIFLGASGGTITPAPIQPIAYDHSLHAGDNAIACEFCHRGVSTGDQATIPSVEQCMFCHSVIAKDSPEIKILAAKWESKEPIDWIRVHRLPDHVRFVHSAHIDANVPCATCHGDITEAKIVKQVNALNMGECMGCHRDTQNQPASSAAPADHVILKDSAPLDCTTCHK